ncbi:DUF6428 family protein [Leptospira sp. WS60.C2]
MKSIQWIDFKNKLDLYPELQLQFIYNENEIIFPNYHITEFKLATIESVDCGGRYDSWKEIILQVLEPNQSSDSDSMKLEKISSILETVSKSIAIPDQAVLRIEFGNSSHAMKQYFVSKLFIDGTTIFMKLVDGKTECKASEVCGLPQEKNTMNLNVEDYKSPKVKSRSCCTPVSAEKQNNSIGCC